MDENDGESCLDPELLLSSARKSTQIGLSNWLWLVDISEEHVGLQNKNSRPLFMIILKPSLLSLVHL